MGWKTEELGFDSRWRYEIFLFSITSRQTLGPTHPPIEWITGDVSPGAKWQKREPHNSLSFSSKVKNCGAIPLLAHTSSWRGA
jgi:hypothetical protein